MPELAPVLCVFLAFTTLAIVGIVALALDGIATDYDNRD